jgi:cyclophilin family peptidyl-prolyl cis-trans isomerase
MSNSSSNPQVLINTSYGPFTVELYPSQAPATVANFLGYVDENFYAGTLFHRVIDQFVVQGGGLDRALQPKPTREPIVLESNTGLSNDRGTMAMARTPEPNSATSQFFVNTVNNTGLNYQSAAQPGYAVFGKVIDGMDVVDAIGQTQTARFSFNGMNYQDVPYPYFLSIYSAARYTPAETLQPTSHTLLGNAYGVAIASYSGNRLDYGVKLNSSKTLTVTKIDGQHSSETVADAGRLRFADGQYAYDLNGNAGKTALMINAAAGLNALTPNIVGAGLNLFDQGLDWQQVAQVVVNTGIFNQLSHADFVKTVYQNVVGSAPDAATQATFTALLDNGEATPAQLLALAANTDLNASTVNLVGLAHMGLAYL